MSILNENVKLLNGLQIPKLGIGTWQVSNDVVKEQIKLAIKNGYRHIDTASAYGNEKGIGDAIKELEINRHELFITTKVPAEIKTVDGARKVIEESLNNLGVDYIDLLLIHCPKPWKEFFAGTDKNYFEENINVWNIMIDYYNQGKVKAIGVSNFGIEDIENLINNTNVKPMVNQIKICIGEYPKDLIDYCKSNNILVESYSPISTGKLLNDEQIIEMANKYDVSVPRLAIKYVIQKDIVTLPKATSEEHIIDNTLLDFEISEKDMEYLDSLKKII